MSVNVRNKCSGAAVSTAPAVLALAVSLGITQLWASDINSSFHGSSGDAVSPLAASPEGAVNKEEAQEGALIFNAHLFSGPSGIALEFTVDPWAPATKTSGQVLDAGSGLRYRYDAIPEAETLPFVSHVNLVSRADTVDVIKASVSYSGQGLMNEFVLPAGINNDNSAHLVGAVAKSIDILAANRADILSLLDSDSTALIVSGPSGIVTTFYGTSVPVQPLVEVSISPQGEGAVKVLSEGLEGKSAATGSELPRNLNVVGLMVTRKGAVPNAVLGYLKDLMNNVEYKGLRNNILKLGMGGHGAWGSFKEYQRRIQEELQPVTEVISTPGSLRGSKWPGVEILINKYEGRPGVTGLLLSDYDTSAAVLTGIKDALEMVNAGAGSSYGLAPEQIWEIQFVVKKSLLSSVYEEFNSVGGKQVISPLKEYYQGETYEDFVKKVIVAKKEETVVVNEGSTLRGDSLAENVRANLRAFTAGAVVGGSIGAGVRVFDRYRQDGKLPHRYSQDELKKLAESSAWDGLRGGISGAATMNIMKLTKAPAPVAGALVGAGNSIYNTYRNGDLNWENAAPVIVKSSAESAVAAAGGWVGSVAAGMLPYGQTMPMQVGGSLAGSLVGHYTYQLVSDTFRDYLPDALTVKPKKTVLKLR